MTATLTESPALPQRIGGLATLARNLGWSWNHDARALYRSIAPTLWRLTRHNPFALLRRVDPARLAACAADPDFLRRYDALTERAAREASNAGTWFATTYPDLTGSAVAYFCAEFGLHTSVPIYSGGLGILAGDQCKAASDLGVPLVGVGLLYTRGYFDQRLRLDGWQEDADERFDVSLTPLERVLGPGGVPSVITVQTGGRAVCVGAWRVMVGRVPVYLLDTDLEQNDPADRELSHRLYGGGHDLRMRQEWILGAGGVRVRAARGRAPAGRGALSRRDPARDERRAPRHLDVPSHDRLAQRPPRPRLARRGGRAGILGLGPRSRERRRVGDASGAEGDVAAGDPGRCPAALGRPVERGAAPGRRRNAARGTGVDHRVRPPVRDLQAGVADLPRSRPVTAAAGQSVATGPTCLLREGPPGRRAGQADAQERVRGHARSPVRGPDRLPGRLRDAPRARPGAGRRSVAQRAARATRGVGDQRHEGRAEWSPPARHPGRMVGGRIRWPQRLGHSRRPGWCGRRRGRRRTAVSRARRGSGATVLRARRARRAARVGGQNEARAARSRGAFHRPAYGAAIRDRLLRPRDTGSAGGRRSAGRVSAAAD